MFAFSLSKLVVLVGVVLAVIYGAKLLNRFHEVREAEAARRMKARTSGGGKAGPAVEETVKCKVCGAYVAQRGAADCGQPGCPFAS